MSDRLDPRPAVHGQAGSVRPLVTHVIVLPGEDASPELRRATSLDSLVTAGSPPFFLWHTAEDIYVPPQHTYRLAAALARMGVPHTVHVFPHGPHSLGLAQGAGDAATWTAFAEAWIAEQIRAPLPPHAHRS